MTSVSTNHKIPIPSPTTSLRALNAIIRERSVLAGMRVFHEETGDVFQIDVPGFRPVVLVGPEAAHFVLVKGRDDFRWRLETDSITKLLIHGVLVEDGESHDRIRRQLSPALHKAMLGGYVDAMIRRTDQIADTWPQDGSTLDMLDEVRRIALLVLMDALFDVDYTPELQRLWDAVLYLIQYISPGLWLIWRGAPRPGYEKYRAQMDDYFFQIITTRRAQLQAEPDAQRTDMLSVLIHAGMDDNLIRDQLMTMLIAGHDTSTASLAWALMLLAKHPDAQARAREEIDIVLSDTPPTAEHFDRLPYLTQVINETLRLYPPIHLGSRIANVDLDYQGYRIPAGTRVLYSIYLTQRHPDYWPDPHTFNPDRFAAGHKHEPYSFLAFGGGRRNCVGRAFAEVETKVVLARLLQHFAFERRFGDIHQHMGATLEPRPSVKVLAARR